MIVDLDYNGEAEVVFSSATKVYAFDKNGASFDTWPSYRSVDAYDCPGGALLGSADLNMDGLKEIIALPSIFDAGGSPLWPGKIPYRAYGPPAIGDINGDGQHEIVACDSEGDSCYAWRVVGWDIVPLDNWPVEAHGGVLPSLTDVDGDETLDVIVGGPYGAYVYNHLGEQLGAIATAVPGNAQNEVMAGDIYNSNGAFPELVTQRSISGELLDATVINNVPTGSVEYGWPTVDLCPASCGLVPTAMGDIDGDNRMEVVAVSGEAYVWDCDRHPSSAPLPIWGQFRKGAGHTGAVGDVGKILVTSSFSPNSLCPEGDAALLTVEVQIRDDEWVPIVGIPASAIYAIASRDTSGTAVPCVTDTLFATSATDSDGKTELTMERIGGCGELNLTLHIQEIVAKQPPVWVRSYDMNGDCAFDGEDVSIFGGYLGTYFECANFDGVGDVSQADFGILGPHLGHFSVDPYYSSTSFPPSSGCKVFCPKGDLEQYSLTATARNVLDSVFVYSSIPADSVWWVIPPPGGTGMNAKFRFLCRSPQDSVYAENDTDANEKTSVSINSGGGHTEDLPITAFIGGQAVTAWTGTVISPDIDADGVVRFTDTMIFSIDDQGSYHYRSDFNCDGFVDDYDLLILNAHYRHSCGAQSHSVAAERYDSVPWSEGVADTIRSVVPNATLDRWLGYKLHPELKEFFEYIRSLDEPSDLANQGDDPKAASISLLPRVTALQQSLPNPFRATALINYQVAPPGGHVRIVIFDAAGRLVRTLVDGNVPPGFYGVSWDGKGDSGREAPSGVYFYQMKAPGFKSNKRMILMR